MKSTTALIAASMLVVSETIAPHHKHIHPDMHTESVATTASYTAALGRMLRSVMRKMENGVVGETFLYELDLPFAQIVQICYHRNRGIDGQLCQCWQVRPVSRGICGQWTGKFASAVEAALDVQARPAMLF